MKNPFIWKHIMIQFYLFKMMFLQHVACYVTSGIINVNVQREPR